MEELQGLLRALPSDGEFSSAVIERLEARVPGVIGLTRSH